MALPANLPPLPLDKCVELKPKLAFPAVTRIMYVCVCVCPLLQEVCEDCSKGLPGVPGMAGTKGEKGDEGKTGIGNASDGCERVRGWG